MRPPKSGGYVPQIPELLEPRRFFSVDLTASINVNAHEPTPYYMSSGEGYTASASIKNIGSTGAPLPITVNFYLSKDKTLDLLNDSSQGLGALNSLGAHKSSTLTQQLDGDGLAPGKYYLVVLVDSQDLYVGNVGPGNPYADVNRDNNTIFSASPVVTVVPDGEPTFNGTSGKDVVKITQNQTHVIVTDNGVVTARSLTDTPALNIQLGASPDKLLADPSVTIALNVSGGGGNDTLIGGSGNDQLSGSGGRDKIYGEAGNDYLIGGGANDYLEGDAGADTCSGGTGNDKLVGGDGKDYLLGGAGDDQFYSQDGLVDTLSGGPGSDSSQSDASDIKASIEGVIA
jgi:Ca2+-binding RTX toxin-like protein